jgi:hypothetical protein
MTISSMTNQFVIIFCNEGLEGVIPVNDVEKDVMWRVLQGENIQSPVPQQINFAILRARYNPQRCYEIYGVNATDGISADDITQMFADSPQCAADTIRRLRNKIYSDRATAKSRVIE